MGQVDLELPRGTELLLLRGDRGCRRIPNGQERWPALPVRHDWASARGLFTCPQGLLPLGQAT